MRSNYFGKIFMPLLAITLLFAYCKKGDTGPAGPAGPAGSAGAAGSQGPKGDTGTANVIYSAWLDVTFAPDTVHTPTGVGTAFTIDTLGFFADIPAAKLDSVMLATGEMKVYLNLGSSSNSAVVPLPYFDVYSGASISPAFLINDISLYADFDASSRTQSGVKSRQYRYILVPGGVLGGRLVKPNWKDYNAIKTFFGIKD